MSGVVPYKALFCTIFYQFRVILLIEKVANIYKYRSGNQPKITQSQNGIINIYRTCHIKKSTSKYISQKYLESGENSKPCMASADT